MTARPTPMDSSFCNSFGAVRAHHEVDARLQLARQFHDASHLEAVRSCDHHQPRMFDACRGEHARRRGVPGDGRDAGPLRTVQHQMIALNDHERQSLCVHHFADGAADPAVAHQDGVIAQQAGTGHRHAMTLRAGTFQQPQ